MVTSEYQITFKQPESEFALYLIGEQCDSYFINKEHTYLAVENDLDERSFLELLAENVKVRNIGLIKHIRTLEPDWLGFEMEYGND